MDSPEFLQYFWDLGSFDEKTSVLSIRGIIDCLDNSVKSPSNPKVKDGSVKSIITLTEVKKGRADLEYTLSRLIKGLESQRECVRRGYSACLSIVLSRYNIPISDVLEGIEKHYLEGMKKEIKGKASSGASGDVRDRAIGLLLGYLAIIRTGFFKKNTSRPYIEQTIENLWMIYGVKMYLQDMVCEIIYLIVRDCCEYDPRLPIKYISSKLGNAFDARFLDKSEINEAKRNQLISQIPVLSLFLKLRIFLEGRDGVVINGVAGCNDISQIHNISVYIGNKWEDWSKLLFNPGYPFLKTRWEIILANFQYLSLFSPRMPSFLYNLLTYILESSCMNEKITSVLVSDILKEIEETYFSGASSPQKHYFGARMILQVLIQLKLAVFSNNHNFSEKSFIKILKNFISGHSKSLSWALKTSLNERNILSSFSTIFLQTLVDIITGKGMETHFANDSQLEEIQDFSRFIFGTLDNLGNDHHKKLKSTSNPSLGLESRIRNLIPFMINDMIVTLFWEESKEHLPDTESNHISRLFNIKEILEKPILTSGKERVRLFWILLKSLMLKTGAKMKLLVKIFSDLIIQEENKSLDSIIISQGILLIGDILKESVDESKKAADNLRELGDKNNDERNVAMDISDNAEEREKNEGYNIYWRRVQWVQSIMLEFVQVSFDPPKSGEERDIAPFVSKLSSQIYPLVDSIITFGASNETWVESYRQAIFPRLEKILGKCTHDMVILLEGIQNDDFSGYSNVIEGVSSYIKNINQLFSKINRLLNYDNNKKLFNDNKKLFNALSDMKSPENRFEVSCSLIESCLLVYYIMEDCNSSFILEMISSLVNSRNEKAKKLEAIFNSMIKLDITNEGSHSRKQNDNLDEDDEYPSCLPGLNLLFQLNLRILDISNNLNTKLVIEFSRKISQLPDLWSIHSNFMDGNDENGDDDESDIELELVTGAEAEADTEAETEIEADDENRETGSNVKAKGSKSSSSLDNDEISQLLKPNIFSKDHDLANLNQYEDQCDRISDNEDCQKDEVISYKDGNAIISHLLNDENTPIPPKYEKQKEQKEQEKLHIQRINSEMQNKLRMLEAMSLISELYKPTDRTDGETCIDLIRTIIILLEGLRLGYKHALYYSTKSHLTIFSDYADKLASIISKLMHMNIFKNQLIANSSELGDLFKFLIHIIGKPVVEPQTMSRWSKKNNGKLLKTKMEGYSKQFETLSINLIALIIAIEGGNGAVIGQLIAQDLIKKWISQKRFGIVTCSFLTKLMHRIKNSNCDHSLKFLIQSFIHSFEETVKFSKSSYQLREYTNLINHTLVACNTGSRSSNGNTDNYIRDMIQTVVRMVDNCIKSDPIDKNEETCSEGIKFTTDMQRLELLKSLISLSKTIIILEDNSGTGITNKCSSILERKILESNSYLNSFNQRCNSGKVKRQINKLRNIINSSNNNKGNKKIKVY